VPATRRALQVLERDPTLGLDDDVLAGAAERDVLPKRSRINA